MSKYPALRSSHNRARSSFLAAPAAAPAGGADDLYEALNAAGGGAYDRYSLSSSRAAAAAGGGAYDLYAASSLSNAAAAGGGAYDQYALSTSRLGGGAAAGGDAHDPYSRSSAVGRNEAPRTFASSPGGAQNTQSGNIYLVPYKFNGQEILVTFLERALLNQDVKGAAELHTGGYKFRLHGYNLITNTPGLLANLQKFSPTFAKKLSAEAEALAGFFPKARSTTAARSSALPASSVAAAAAAYLANITPTALSFAQSAYAAAKPAQATANKRKV